MVEVEVVEGDRQTERAREAAAGQIISLSHTVVALSLSPSPMALHAPETR